MSSNAHSKAEDIATLLVVEDDLRVGTSLDLGLTEEGYRVVVAHNLRDAHTAYRKHQIVLVVLDLGLPDGDGFAFLRTIRERDSLLPVLILTARDQVSSRVAGLDLGADDYIVKPFAFQELVARIRARLRTTRQVQNAAIVQIGDLVIDRINRNVCRGTDVIALTNLEFDLLAYLAAASGCPVSRDMLVRDVWHINSRATSMDKIIDVHISHLRAKIDQAPNQKLIHTIRGVGFVLTEAPV